ncbi:MAG: GntR family transcriptional regulator [Sedimentitalea sp.]
MAKHKQAHCAADLRARILTQDLPPGSDLDEASLAEEYGISRTPLREVLHRLAGGGFVRLCAALCGLRKTAGPRLSPWTFRPCVSFSRPRR